MKEEEREEGRECSAVQCRWYLFHGGGNRLKVRTIYPR
jgi:hypothetical protein